MQYYAWGMVQHGFNPETHRAIWASCGWEEYVDYSQTYVEPSMHLIRTASSINNCKVK
jgi:hypothetical protein